MHHIHSTPKSDIRHHHRVIDTKHPTPKSIIIMATYSPDLVANGPSGYHRMLCLGRTLFLHTRRNKMSGQNNNLKNTTTQDAVRVIQPNPESVGASENLRSGSVPTLRDETVDPPGLGELPTPMDHSGTGRGKNSLRQGLSGAQWRKLQKQLAVDRDEAPPTFKRKRKPGWRVTPSDASGCPGISGGDGGVRFLLAPRRRQKRQPPP